MGRIIKETASHNAALLAKEAAEAQARLDNLTEAEERKRRKLNPTSEDIRRRQMGAISSILLGRKRKPANEEKDAAPHAKHASIDDKEGQSPEKDRRKKEERRQSGKDDEDRARDRRSHRREKGEERRTRDDRRDRERSRSPRAEHRSHRHRSPLSGDDTEDYSRHRRRKSKRSHDGELVQKELLERKRHGRLAADDISTSKSREKRTSRDHAGYGRRGSRMVDDDDGSDPLEDLIGPAPKSPVRRRGRGVARGPSALDSRFSDGYDPQADAQPELEDKTGDWDEAVETFRDHQKWKQQGADRLRAAGFTEEEIKRWEKGGEKDIGDVRWAKAGEKRAWDRGKDEEADVWH